jgi:hypothetical protein
MPISRKVLRVFLSSPGDVAIHRETVRQVVSVLNEDPLVAARGSMSIVAYDTPGAEIPLSANRPPQASVNAILPLPSECDLTIALLWGKLGTPLTPARQSDSGVRSTGTLWEINNALKAARPVWIYIKKSAPDISLDDPAWEKKKAQYREVKDFEQNAVSSAGALRYGIHHFESDEQLRTQLTAHLKHFINISLYTAKKRVARPRSNQNSSTQMAVEEAIENPPEIPQSKKTEFPVICDLSKYPIGPMIRDPIVHSLARELAELFEGEHVRTIFSQINQKLAAARRSNEPELRLSSVDFTSALGSRFFWSDVLHKAAVQGRECLQL